MVRFVPIAILLGALGCGSGSAGGSFNGVVRGQPMKPADAISSPARVSLGPISADVGGVVLTDVPGVCGRVTANSEPKNGKALVLFLADFNRQTLTATAPAGPGTFDVVNPNAPGIPPPHAAVVNAGVVAHPVAVGARKPAPVRAQSIVRGTFSPPRAGRQNTGSAPSPWD